MVPRRPLLDERRCVAGPHLVEISGAAKGSLTEPLEAHRRTGWDPVPATSVSPLLTGIPLRPAKAPLKLPRLTLLAVLLIGCGEAIPPRSLHELTIQDSTYLDPETLLPYTGRVFRMFETDAEMRQLRGELVDGA